jgi:DNA-binding NarL/FixJ family response regulator
LLEAIEAVGRGGELFFSAPAARLLAQEHVRQTAPEPEGVNRLSNREREVLVAIAGGSTSKEIAQRLGLSTRTIETHREGIMRKLDIHTIAGLTKLCIAEGLVELE